MKTFVQVARTLDVSNPQGSTYSKDGYETHSCTDDRGKHESGAVRQVVDLSVMG